MTYLLSLNEIILVGRRCHCTYEDPSHSRQQHSLVFMLLDTAGSFVRVSRKMFMETFRITTQTVETIVKLGKQKESTYLKQHEGIRTQICADNDHDLVHSHIIGFPKVVSHYTKSRSGDHEFLSTDLTGE